MSVCVCKTSACLTWHKKWVKRRPSLWLYFEEYMQGPTWCFSLFPSSCELFFKTPRIVPVLPKNDWTRSRKKWRKEGGVLHLYFPSTNYMASWMDRKLLFVSIFSCVRWNRGFYRRECGRGARAIHPAVDSGQPPQHYAIGDGWQVDGIVPVRRPNERKKEK